MIARNLATLAAVGLLLTLPARAGALEERTADVSFRGQIMTFPDIDGVDDEVLGSLGISGIVSGGRMQMGGRVIYGKDFLVEGVNAGFAGAVFTYNVLPKRSITPYFSLALDFTFGDINEFYDNVASAEVGARFFFADRIGINLGVGYSSLSGRRGVSREAVYTGALGVSVLFGHGG